MWFWIIFVAVVVALIGLQWVIAPYSHRRRGRISQDYNTNLDVVEMQARSTRNQTSGPFP